jgi:putative ABC transport system permease protein
MERTKEIGILRSLGASKRNISQVFNAETFIVGCCAGVLGIGVSLLLLFPINSIIERLSGITGLTAQIPVESAVILILISIVITLIGGLIPAKKAANKDPVIALRTE